MASQAGATPATQVDEQPIEFVDQKPGEQIVTGWEQNLVTSVRMPPDEQPPKPEQDRPLSLTPEAGDLSDVPVVRPANTKPADAAARQFRRPGHHGIDPNLELLPNEPEPEPEPTKPAAGPPPLPTVVFSDRTPYSATSENFRPPRTTNDTRLVVTVGIVVGVLAVMILVIGIIAGQMAGNSNTPPKRPSSTPTVTRSTSPTSPSNTVNNPPAVAPTSTSLAKIDLRNGFQPAPLHHEIDRKPGEFSVRRTTISNGAGQFTQLWVYEPKDIQSRADRSLPCVMIAPAGTPLITGISLSNGDVPEHEPYANAGFVVVAYSLSGPMPDTDDPNNPAFQKAMRDFAASDAGLRDYQAARDWIKVNLPQVAPDAIFIAGHSSAGTHALMVASRDPSLRGCVAYAPVVDLQGEFAGAGYATLRAGPIGKVIDQFSPLQMPSPMMPVLAFFARDDNPGRLPKGREYIAKTRFGVLVETPSGGHYDSMISPGIEVGIQFMRFLLNEKVSVPAPVVGD